MKNPPSKKLSFGKVMFQMSIIMIVWAIFWYPFYYFVFPENLSIQVNHLIAISREYLRMLPAIFFLIYYRNYIKVNFKEIFSLKFNYKWFLITLLVFVSYMIMGSYFTNGNLFSYIQTIQDSFVKIHFGVETCAKNVYNNCSASRAIHIINLRRNSF